MLKILRLTPAFVGLSCGKDFPDAPTIVTGEVIDEAGAPVSGVLFILLGTKNSGLGSVSIFKETDESGINGKFHIEKVIPNDSKTTELLPADNEFYTFGLTHNIFLKKGDQYIILGNSIPIVPDKYGMTLIYRFKVVKK
ncbi:hypothetical protein DYBT9275_02315 [Dyadobacter sp. CECT 9275]|uniref:Uncharacterized protein n=2 Tax=Dyadobacter helix TaxID=2822344 RepID=A0A916NBS2_9BACT|nr:hypothetical protein DYBT9275_02315 [Dyadobacter sp. CECT 9275]